MTNRPDSVLPMASLYIGDLHQDVTEALLYEKFISAGQIVSLRICRDSQTNQSLGYAYVNFSLYADAEKVLDTMNFDLLKEKPMRIMWSQRDPSLRRSGIGNIFIKNLDKSIDNKAMFDTFSAFGNILSCKVAVDDDGHSKGYAFVHFERAESAKTAIEKVNGMLLNGKKVYVGQFIPRTEREKVLNEKNQLFTNIFIKNFGRNFTEEHLYNLFTKFGTITSCVIMKNLDGSSKGFGFVNYQDHQSAERALNEMNKYEIDENCLYVGRAQSKLERELELKRSFEQIKQERLGRVQGANVYVKQLDDSIDDDKLRQEFISFGAITSAKVMMESGRSKGFGFVCFSTADEANKAINKMNGRMLGSKPLYVSLAQRKDERKLYLNNLCMQRLRYQTLAYPAIPPFLIPTVTPQGPRFFNHVNQSRATTRWPIQAPPLRLNGTYLPTMIQAPTFRQPFRQSMQGGASVNNNRATAQMLHPRPITGQQRPNSRYTTNLSTNNNMIRSFNTISSTTTSSSSAVGNGDDNLMNATTTNMNTINGFEDKQFFGDLIYRFTEKYYPDLASKITGMLLEMEAIELQELIRNQDLLRSKIEEAVAVLHAYETNKIIATTVQD